MLFTVTTTYEPATDLGYLLHKSPYRAQSQELGFGVAHVFYPEATATRCTAALLVEVDPIGLVRGRKGASGEGLLEQYVNDRPYAASSFLSVAMGAVFGTALNGRSKERQALAETAIPLVAKVTALPCRGGEALLRRLFEPLGYEVKAQGYGLDAMFPEWGASAYYDVELSAVTRLGDLLTHLYVLMPVLDNEKHYWVGDAEVEKLLRHGEGWLAEHPEKELVVSRYLKRQGKLTRSALAQLKEEAADEDEAGERHDEEEQRVERPISLHEQRLGSVMSALRGLDAKRVVDLGCGEGKLLRMLLADGSFEQILGMDVSHRSLEIARNRLKLDSMGEKQRGRIDLIQGSLMYRDARLSGFDAATVVEVIEHLDAARLAAFERVLFEFARPGAVVMTTPNAEYNVRFESLPSGQFRHRDHRFEWTRAEFRAWAETAASRHGYRVTFVPVGPEDAVVGAPTQMGVFTRADESQRDAAPTQEAQRA